MIFSSFQNCRRCERYLKDNKHNSLHLLQNITTIAAIWRENMLGYLSADIICSEKRTVFRERSSRKNCELRETDYVQGQISVHIFNVKWRLLCLLSFKYFSSTRAILKIGEYSRIFPRFSRGIGSLSTRVFETRVATGSELIHF